jgi:hypothetical protein
MTGITETQIGKQGTDKVGLTTKPTAAKRTAPSNRSLGKLDCPRGFIKAVTNPTRLEQAQHGLTKAQDKPQRKVVIQRCCKPVAKQPTGGKSNFNMNN